MKKNNGVDWGWILILLWMTGSFIGVLYSFRFLASAALCLIVWWLMAPRDKRKNDGYAALEKVWEWESNGGPRPSADVFVKAADWFMYNIDAVRKEDLDTWVGAQVPEGVKPYIKSERDLPRPGGVVF